MVIEVVPFTDKEHKYILTTVPILENAAKPEIIRGRTREPYVWDDLKKGFPLKEGR